MIYGVGIDLLEISRVSRLLQNDAFMRRVYTEGEREYIASKGEGGSRVCRCNFLCERGCFKGAWAGSRDPAA